jgi:hypothetical protein
MTVTNSSGTSVASANGFVSTNPQTVSTSAFTALYANSAYSGTASLSGASNPNSITRTLTVSAPPPTYDESVSMPATVVRGTAFSFSISGGQPNTAWSYNSGFSSASGTLNSSGNASGTVPDNAQPTIGTYTYDFFFAGTSHTRSVSVTANSPVVVYNESISGPGSVTVGQSFDVTISGGSPNTGFTWSGSASGSASLDGSGNGTFAGVTLPAVGSYSWTFTFAATGHSRTFSTTAVAATAPPTALAITVNSTYYVPNPIVSGFGGTFYFNYTASSSTSLGAFADAYGNSGSITAGNNTASIAVGSSFAAGNYYVSILVQNSAGQQVWSSTSYTVT